MKGSPRAQAGSVDAVLRRKSQFSQLEPTGTVRFQSLKPLAVMVYGAPGSGKGTFGKLLCRLTGWPHISTGHLLRKHITDNTEFAQASIGILNGEYVPDQIADELVAQRIELDDCKDSFILDGYPRTLPQCTAFLPLLERMQIEPIIVRLQLDQDIIKSRLMTRVTCSFCGTTFNLVHLLPSLTGLCDECGSPLATRIDDQVMLIDKRIQFYDKLTGPVERYLLESSFRCRQFDASLEPGQIVSRFLNGLVGDSLANKSFAAAQ